MPHVGGGARESPAAGVQQAEGALDLKRVLADAHREGMNLTDAVIEGAASAYLSEHPGAALTEFSYHGARFLFDASPGVDRSVLAIGRPASPTHSRDEGYQRGFPIPDTCAGRPLDRGHLLPHMGGGGYGPNLFAQDRALNRGWSRDGRLYRDMERQALASAPSTLFVALLVYSDASSLPMFVQLGILGPERCESRVFRNRFDHLEEGDRLSAELAGATDGQLGALGEEAAAVLLEEGWGATLVAMGDAGMPRTEGRQDLDLVAIVDGELVALEVKTMYRSKRAGRLTRAGNLARPRLRSTADGRRQASQRYVAQRIDGIVDTGDPYVGIRVQVVVVDLEQMLAQFFDINDLGNRVQPVGAPMPCQPAVEAALGRIRAHRGHL